MSTQTDEDTTEGNPEHPEHHDTRATPRQVPTSTTPPASRADHAMNPDADLVLDGLDAVLHRARPHWMKSAACRGLNPTMFTPGKPTAASRAFTICGGCTVRSDCLTWAIEIGDDVAILGGTDPAARRRIARQRSTDATP